MQSDAPDPSTTESTSTSTHDQPQQPDTTDPSSRSSKRQRLDSRPTPLPDTADEPAPAPSSSQQTLNLAPDQTATSSREPAEMHRSSTPPDASGSGAIKYTRTGRVSKATKGQRVHHCEECGKTYTRAEHLRRHQQNHKPGAFPCDVAGCGRSFHREDLLVRHKARHNDPLNPPSRRHSVGSQSSAPDAGGMVATSSQAPGLLQAPTSVPTTTVQPTTSDPEQHHPPTTSSAARYNNFSTPLFPTSEPSTSEPFFQFFDDLSLTPKRMIPLNELRDPVPIPVDGGSAYFTNPFTSTNRPFSPEDFHDYDYDSSDETAALPYYHPQAARPRYRSDASFLYAQPPSASRSPASSGSSTTYLPPWATSEAQYGGGVAAYVAHGLGHRQSISSFPYESSSDFAIQQRDRMEQNNFHLPSGYLEHFASDDSSDGGATPNYDLYLRAYWSWVHELFPVIHRPTYDHETASPLLRTAILALGGQAAGDPRSVSNARVLHEKCLKVLRNRTTQNTHTYLVPDLQAIVLVEIYATFKSRRPPLQFSRWFEVAFRRLSEDPEAAMSAPNDTPTESGSVAGDLTDYGLERINALCKQRLLLACYSLEQQHNLLFGRSTTTCFGEIGFILPFPSAQQTWEGHQSDIPDDAAFDRLAQATIATSCMTEPAMQPYDIFRSLLVQIRFCEAAGEARDFVESGPPDFPLLFATEQTPRGRVAYHTFMMCKTTPIRDLLAVAGESWIMAEKLSSQSEFTGAQLVVRDWARQDMVNESYGINATKPAIQHALYHAFSILRIHQQSPRCGLLFQEWSVYLAATIIWARAYVLRGNNIQPGLAGQPTRTETDLDQAMTNIINSGSSGIIGWVESRDVLEWTKAKIERFDIPHSCGLISGALDVLGKLIVRGNEDHWF